jgi:alanine dehydrogenase
MKIGVPAEVKNNEHRVGLTPESVKTLCDLGHPTLRSIQCRSCHWIYQSTV